MPEQTLMEQLTAILNVEIIAPMEGNEAQGLHNGGGEG